MSKTIKLSEERAKRKRRPLDVYSWKCPKCGYLLCETDIFTALKLKVNCKCPHCWIVLVGEFEFGDFRKEQKK